MQFCTLSGLELSPVGVQNRAVCAEKAANDASICREDLVLSRGYVA